MMKYIKKISRVLKMFSVFLALVLAFGQTTSSLAADDTVKIIPNLQPPSVPSGLSQFTADNTRALPAGSVINANQFVIRSLITDPDPQDTLVIEIEIRPIGTSFLSTPNYASPAIASKGSPLLIPILLSDVPEGSYHWQQRVRDAAGHVTNWVPFGDNVETDADLIIDQTPPAVPSDVKVASGVQSATVTWSSFMASAGVAAVEILRGASFGAVTTLIAQVDSAQTNFTDTGLQPGTIYWYGLRAKDAAGNTSALSMPVSVITDSVIDDSSISGVTFSGVWGEVKNLDATVAQNGTFHWAPGDSGARASYKPALPTAGQYEVLVSWIVKPPEFIGNQARNAPYIVTDSNGSTTTFVDQSRLANGTASQSAAWSSWKSLGVYTIDANQSLNVTLVATANGYVTTDASRFVAIRPLPPVDLTITDHPNDEGTTLDLQWNASPSQTVTLYRIYRSTLVGQFDFAKPLAESTKLTYQDATVIAGQIYFYTVTAYDGTHESLPVVYQTITPVDNIAPAQPAELNIQDGDGFLGLSWPAAAGVAKYEITVKRRQTAAVIVSILLPGNQTSTKITGLSNGETYTVDLVALDSAGNRSPFIGVVGQPKASVIEPVVQKVVAVKRTVAPKTSTAKPMVQPTQKPQPTVEKPAEPPTEVEPGGDEGAVKGVSDEQPSSNRSLVIFLILVIAIIVGIGGYYGYDWWVGGAEVKSDRQRLEESTRPLAERPSEPPSEPKTEDKTDFGERPEPKDRPPTTKPW